MKKIMFNDKYGLTEAVLNGSKTQTRRICKYDRPSKDWEIGFPCFKGKDYDNDNKCISPLDGAFGWHNTKTGEELKWNIPKYKVGEVIAVAQPYKDVFDYSNCINPFDYEKEMPSQSAWSNKMFVKSDIMPHRIQISNIRIQKLQDISDEDCLAEGVELNTRQFEYSGEKLYCVKGLGHWRSIGCDNFNSPQEAYAALIDKIAGKGIWESNPYVFVYDFKLIK